MMNKMIPLSVPNLCGKEREYLNNCIDTTFVSTVGEYVNKFEELIAQESGAPASVCVNSGTSALHAALVAVGVKRDDLVILPNLTFIASANSIAYTGAETWLMDVTADSWTLDPQQLEVELAEKTMFENGCLVHKESGKRVSCIMPVYTLGCPADMDRINEIAAKYKLPIVADAAAALGAQYKEKNLAELATITTFSFNGNKTITSGGGGALISKDEELLKYIKHLTTTARVGTDYYHDEIGFNYRMTNIEAALGCAQIENLQKFVGKKREIQTYYSQSFNDIDGVKPFSSPDWAHSACWFSGVVLEKFNEEKVLRIIEELGKSGIMARPFWIPISQQPKFKHSLKANLEVSEGIWRKILVLPCSTNITKEELEHVSSSFKELYLKVLN